MNTNELVTKAIREGIDYADGNTSVHRDLYEFEDMNRLAATLSAGLVVLTEGELTETIRDAYISGHTDGWFKRKRESAQYASRIMREVKEGNDG